MKRFILLAILFSSALSGVVLWQASAQESAPMTEAHINRIRTHCIEAQTTLSQLHASDALLRVNRGRLYESIATKLMVPFNSRVAVNQLDDTDLVAKYTTYERQLGEFRSNYQSYEQSMSDTLKTNCTNQPVAFYDKVIETHAKRQKVHGSTTALHKTIREYGTTFDAFSAKFKKEQP